jgi:chitodextrinase
LAPPLPPQGLVVSDSSVSTIQIRWRKNTEADFLRYRIYRATSPHPTTKVDSTTAGIADTSRRYTGLTNGTRYYFRVTAVDSSGNESVFSSEVNAVPADRIPPAAPQNLVVTDSSSGTVTIKWRKNTEVDFLRYRIYRSTSPNPTTKVDSTTGGAADTSKTFTGLTNGTRYYFRLSAVDSSGNESAYSSQVNATPMGPVGVGNNLNQVPEEYSFAQNYPNPFNPSTTIRFGLPERSRISVRVYNILGQLVEELFAGEADAGYVTRQWDAKVASGLYYCRFVAVSLENPSRRFVDVKKMVLVK